MTNSSGDSQAVVSSVTDEQPHQPLPLDVRSFRRVMGRFATGVTVVTTIAGQEVHGMTVNAFASVSLEPMLVLISIDKQTLMHELLLRGHVFAVNILTEDQENLSRYFATRDRPHGPSEFAGISCWEDMTGAPLLEGALAYIECEVERVYDGGDHSLFMGRIVSLWLGEEDKKPLLYYSSSYARI